MDKPYRELRKALRAADISNAYLAEKLGIAPSSVSLRLNAHHPWEQDRMYLIMDLLHLPHDQLHIYFPPKGRQEHRTESKATPQERELVNALRTLSRCLGGTA